MKNYQSEIILLIIQLFMFYIFPLFCGPTDIMGMVFIILLTTFILAIIIGCISKYKIKYLYPIIISILFIPSIFIYYNESALIHAWWYFCVASIGLVLGIILNEVFHYKKN